MPKMYGMTDQGYSVCCKCANNITFSYLGKVVRKEILKNGTIVCSQCDRFIPTKGRNYKGTENEWVMSELGLIHKRNDRPSKDEVKKLLTSIK